MTPAIRASAEAIEGVCRTDVIEGDPPLITLEVEDSLDTDDVRRAIEESLSRILQAKGLELGERAEIRHYTTTPSPKTENSEKKIRLSTAIGTTITAVLLAIFITFSLTTVYHRVTAPDATLGSGQGEVDDSYAEIDVIDRLFRALSVYDLDDEALLRTVIDSYIAATGDPYARYFDAEEYAEQLKQQNGQMSGIGVTVVKSEVEIDGVTQTVIAITNVNENSPAKEADIMPGDLIVAVGKGENKQTVHSIGYETAMNMLRGETGTECAFTVLSKSADGTITYKDHTVTRAEVVAETVFGHKYAADPTVGIIKITRFDNTTAPHFTEVVNGLVGAGCTHFVIDLRDNPGGMLTAVEDMLIYFLEEGDLMISTKDNAGKEEKSYVSTEEKDGKLQCGSGELTAADVGKYKDLNIAVLINGETASAAELFTANVRDYELGIVVGTKSYGKGSMQTTYSLSRYGFDGALKLTTRFYYPPSGEDYNGKGITPKAELCVELSEEAKSYPLPLLPDELDNQLATAISAMKR
jgi:carboxyl-terminal processing protease